MPAHDRPTTLVEHWLTSIRRAEVQSSLASIYTDCAAEIARRGPTCWTSGKCCNFREYGHLLYVTGLEAAYALDALRRPPVDSPATSEPAVTDKPPRSLRIMSAPSPQPTAADRGPALTPESLAAAVDAGGCPFQVAKLCGVHAIRPLGCRIYFCDQAAQGWQQDLSETLLARIRGLHDQFEVEYRYGEWRSMLGLFLEAGWRQSQI